MMKHARPTKTAVVSRAKSDHLPDSSSGLDEAGENENCSFKWAAVYWKEGGINLPENGRMKLKNNTHLSFRGIFGTKLDCDLTQISVETESRMNGMIRDAFRVVVRSDSSKEDGVDDDGSNISYLFTTVIKDPTAVVERIQSAIDQAHIMSTKNGADEINDQPQLRRLPPDDVLQKMTIMGKRKIKGVSMQDYFEVAWSEGNECEKQPMYEPFLTSCGKNNVKVQKWESQEGGFKGEWCGESYTQQRIVTFNFMKKTIGETLVSVQHTQRCRRVDNDRCIVHMTLDMKGFPFADCFVVEVRHVASRVGENDILVEIGLFVRFLKSCMFESKIRTNTSAETTKLQMDLLDRVIIGCKPYAIEQTETAGTDEVEEDDNSDCIGETESAIAVKRDSGVIHVLTAAIQFILTPILSMLLMPLIRLKLFDPLPPPKTTREALDNVRRRTVQLKEVSLKNNVPAEQKISITKEIEAINAALKRIERSDQS